ncbi:hypothetical protein SLNSH_20600 [Alsobacter soli]|uniref:O-antigen ligase-related domain-containing protein n=1 Tax=Alsobacter soli TaxID=2109933 RepID=A0A2T1HNA6_9HYPH|nr:O-antigen ligase family protein [Alsobacter soli]PSC03132.1 hypothetical protein SLNSH_20600 [Alsobacter soli]
MTSAATYSRHLAPPLAIHRIVLHLLIIAELVFSSRLYLAFLPSFAQRLILALILLTSAGYTALALARGYFAAAFVQLVCLALIITQMLVFEGNTSLPVEWNGIGQYLTISLFVPIFMLCNYGLADRFMDVFGRYTTIYALLYVPFVLLHNFNLIPMQIVQPILSNDVERGDRLFAHSGALLYAWFLILGRLRFGFTFGRAIIVPMCLLALLLTVSRVYLTCAGVITVFFLARVPYSLTRVICLLALGTASAVLLYGALDPTWNPFAGYLDSDTSGRGRMLEYQVAQVLVQRSPIFGYGLPSSGDQAGFVTGLTFFAGNDLGAFGVYMDLGIIGLVLYFAASVLATQRLELPSEPFRSALFYAGCTLALDGCLSPMLFIPGGTIIFAVILGVWLAQKAQS